MKIQNNGAIMHTPLCQLDMGENEVDAKLWAELEKMQSVKTELETKRLEKVGPTPVRAKPVAEKEKEDKPKGKK